MAVDAASMRRSANKMLNDFTTSQKAIIALLLAILAVGGYAFSKWASAPSYTPLFSNLSGDDASAITSKLSAKKIPYQLTDGGKTIEVPNNVVYQERVDMSAAGLPSGGQGYSLLDKQGLTTSDFIQHVDYQRALEGELAKTISAINGVQGATVHLVIPQDDVFSDDSQKPSASVLVMTAPGTELSSTQVQAIVNLVSSGVEGLSTDQVTVADSKGNVLAAPGQKGSSLAGGDQSAQTNTYNNQLASDIQNFLTGVLGPGHAYVRARAELDFDTKQTVSQTYDNTAAAPTLSENTSAETASGLGSSAAVGGVLGVNNTAANAANAAGNGTYTKNMAERDFGVNKIVETRNAAPGAVKRLSVAVMLDSAVKGVNVTTLKQQVAAAAGIDTTRGDVIAVNTIPFDKKQAEEAAKALKVAQGQQSMSQMIGLAKTLGAMIIVAIVLFLALRSARKRARSFSEQSFDIRELGVGGGGGGGGSAARPVLSAGAPRQAGALMLDDGEATYSIDELQNSGPLGVTAEGAERIQLEGQVTDLIDSQPDEVASLLRTWLADRRG
jgi:flagellar M-ring protein FliF